MDIKWFNVPRIRDTMCGRQSSSLSLIKQVPVSARQMLGGQGEFSCQTQKQQPSPQSCTLATRLPNLLQNQEEAITHSSS